MRVVVTGGNGKAGRALVPELRQRGHEVTSVDVVPGGGAILADLADRGQAHDVMSGADAVVHLAAIPAPGIRSDGETFRNNTLSTHNVFSAAVAHRVRRVVWASSETLIGLPFDREPPRYAPIDEAHPRLPESHYALAKLLGEEMADQFARWSGIPFVSLRYSNIMEPDDYRRFPEWQEDPGRRSWNLWGYVDAGDVALATRLALESGTEGHRTFLVAAADTCMLRPSRELMAEVYPDVEVRSPVEGNQTLLSIDAARRILGYEPTVSWREMV